MVQHKAQRDGAARVASRATRLVAIAAAALMTTSAGATDEFASTWPGLTWMRTFDGSDTNPYHSDWGKAGIPLLRTLLPAAYPGDGSGNELAGPGRPSPRVISNAVAAQPQSLPSSVEASSMLWAFGQFLDHDISLSHTNPADPGPIPVPNDPMFTAPIPFNRSEYVVDTNGVRQQVNAITAWIDASMVYGSDAATATMLREPGNSGRLLTMGNAGLYLPTVEELRLPVDPTKPAGQFVAGDERVNEQVALMSMHTLFVREHNRLADKIAATDPALTGEQIYHMARKIVGAEIQSVTYNEFLPALLGDEGVAAYEGFKSGVNPGIETLFSTAAYRLGHTFLNPTYRLYDSAGKPHDVPLRDCFFNPSCLTEYGLAGVFEGLLEVSAQERDRFVIDEVRNFLFHPTVGLDLVALNLQRGRDHGLPSYQEVVEAIGSQALLPAEVLAILEVIYDEDIDDADIDLFIGLLSEEAWGTSLLGETHTKLIREQFERLRDGDPYFYLAENVLPKDLVDWLDGLRLCDIVAWNTDLEDVQPHVMFLATAPANTVDAPPTAALLPAALLALGVLTAAADTARRRRVGVRG